MDNINWILDELSPNGFYHLTYGRIVKNTLCGISLGPLFDKDSWVSPYSTEVKRCPNCQEQLWMMARGIG